jgi:hypothetical protein
MIIRGMAWVRKPIEHERISEAFGLNCAKFQDLWERIWVNGV